MRRLTPLAAGLAGLLVVATASTGRAADVPPAPTVSYTASTERIANPERGFYHYTATHFRGTDTGDAPLDESRLRAWRTQEDVTLALRLYYLDDDTARPLPEATLRSIEADMATARRAGVKLVVRFAYSEDTDADAPLPVVLGHIRQLAPVLGANADVVAFLQAGFVGRWGEWYYSRHFAHDPGRPWDLSAEDRAARKAVVDTLLQEISPEIPLQLRYVSSARGLVDPAHVASGRVGLHDDCFLASDTDYGTYQNDDERRWLQEGSAHAPVGGETCAVNGVRTSWSTARSELAGFHWTYLNADYHRDVLTGWGEGYREAERRLGYRLRLVSGTIPTRVRPGAPMDLRFRVTNDGYAAPTQWRPVYLVFRQGSTVRRVPLAADVRALTPGSVQDATFRVTAPTTTGTWTLGVWMPDAATRLRANPAYSLRLADQGMWEPATGINVLPTTLEVR